MNLTELGAALGPFFDISGSPSHQQLRDAFARHALSHLDPAPEGRKPDGSHLGKMKRIRHGRCQAVEATESLRSLVKTSRGVRKPRMARGRSLSSSAMASR